VSIVTATAVFHNWNNYCKIRL